MTALDEVAWLLNLRGGDVSHNPVFVSYVLVQDTTATLYVDQKKVCTAACCVMMMMRDDDDDDDSAQLSVLRASILSTSLWGQHSGYGIDLTFYRCCTYTC